MNYEDDKIRMNAFANEILTLEEKYILERPITDEYNLAYRKESIHRRFGFFFTEDCKLDIEPRIDCLTIYRKYFPEPEGSHGSV